MNVVHYNTKRGKGLRIKQELEEGRSSRNKGHNEKTTVAWQTMALSPLGAWGPVGPGQEQRPAHRTRPAVQGACMTYMTLGLQSQQPPRVSSA